MIKKNTLKIIVVMTVILVCLTLITVFGLYNQDNFSIDSEIQDKNACIIVKYTADMDGFTFDGIKARQALADNMELVELSDPAHMAGIIEGLEAMAGVEYAQPNYLLKTDEIEKELSYQWGLNNSTSEYQVDINAEAALEVEQGSGSITVGVLDTGIDISHPNIKKALKNNGYNFVDNNSEIYSGNEDKHGTGIAGVIAAQDIGKGIRGVADGIKLTPLKVMDRYRGYTSDIILAIQYAEQEGIEIINCSFGSEQYNPALEEAMRNAAMLFICSAGNKGKNVDEAPYYPACFDLANIISVGSINEEGKLSSFSNYGDKIDLLAPGEEVYSTIPDEKYYSFSGTSMSAAYVTGVAALLKSQDSSISIEDLAARLCSTVRKYSDYANKVSSGGIIDAYAALTNDVAPMPESPLFEAEQNESESANAGISAEPENTNDIVLSADEASAVNTAMEIEPIIAQQLHYGESGVNPASGNFSFTVTDFNDSAPGGNFVFARYYNSLDQADEKKFGRGWSSMLDAKIYDAKATGKNLSVTMPNGSTFEYTLKDGSYFCPTTRNTLTKGTDNTYTLKTPAQEQYVFTKTSQYTHRLTHMKDKTGNTVTQIVYSGQFPAYILDSAGRKYTVHEENGITVSSITDPYGRTVRYDYHQGHSPSYAASFFIMTEWIDVMGISNSMVFQQKDNQYQADYNLPYTDTYVSQIQQTYPDKTWKVILQIDYNINSYDPDYGKVMSYTDAYEETYAYDYGYMSTDIERINKGDVIQEDYDSYMYVYKTDYPVETNGVTERRFYRPGGRNYGEVIQEWSGAASKYASLTTYIRDPETGNVQQRVNPDGSTVSYWYDTNNNVIGVLDEEDNCTLYEYNAENELLKKANYLLKGFPDISDHSQIGQYITQHADQFVVESYVYSDGGGGCQYTSLLEQVTDAEGNVISLSYDKYGNILTSSKPYASGESPVYDRYEYYVNYLNTSDVSAGIQSKTYVDFLEESQSGIYTLGMEKRSISPMAVTSISYTDNNGCAYKAVSKDGAREETQRSVYDIAGRKLKEISPSAYAENGCSAFEKITGYTVENNTYYRIDFESPSKEYAYATEYQYITETGAGYNQVESIASPSVDGARDVQRFAYEKANITLTTDPDGRSIKQSYDALDRKKSTSTTILDADQKSRYIDLQQVSRTIDLEIGFRTKTEATTVFVRDRSEQKKYRAYHNDYNDYRGNLTQSELQIYDQDIGYFADWTRTDNVYNKNGTLAKSYNAYGNVTYHTYDNLNRETETWEAIDSDSATYFRYTKKDYYKNGKIKTEYICTQPVKIPVDAEDQVIPSNEEFRALTRKDGQTSSPADYVVTSYTYYANGNIKSVTASNGTQMDYAYDNDGNLISEIKNGVKTTYENTYFGQVEKKHEYVNPDNMELTENDVYEMDGEFAVLTTQYQYAHGLLSAVIYPNGTSITYEYDARDRQIAVNQTGSFVNHAGETVAGVRRSAKKLDWKDNLKEESVEEIVDGVTTVIARTVYAPKEDKARYVSNLDHCLVYEQKITKTAYDPETGDETVLTSLYYTDPLDRVIAVISPNHYIADGVVSLEHMYKDTFSDEEKEMNRTEYQYNELGQLIREIQRYRDPNDNNAWKKVVTKTYAYDQNGNVTEAVDAMGNSTKTRYTLANKVFIEKDPVAQEKHYAYSQKYTYDALGRVVKAANSAKYDTHYNYDDVQNTVTQTNVITQPDGTQETIENYSKFDANKNLIETYAADPARKFTYRYNERNQVVESHVPYDETIPESNVAVTYDSMGNVVRKVIGSERLEVYAYDSFGNNTSVTVSKLDGTEAVTTAKAYDSRGNIRIETDGNQNPIEHKYDGFGREIETVAVHSTYFDYDSNGNLTAQTDWRGNTVGMIYDPLNRLIQKTDADGTVVEKLYYNANGLQTKSVDALGQETTFVYDPNSRLLSTTDPLGHTSGQTYNRAGQVGTKYDGNGNITSYEYDELGRLRYAKQTADGGEEVTSFTYDLYGNLLIQTNGEGHTTTFEYNVLNLPTAKIDHDGAGVAEKTERYQYDERGNLIEKTDRNGVTLNYVYDIHNRLTQTRFGETVLISQSYDGNGNKLTMQDTSGTTVRTYDALNRVLTKEVPNMGTSTYQYDITSGVPTGYVAEKMTDPKQNETIKVYDKNGRLNGVKDGESADPAVYEYYPNGAQKKVTNADGTSASFTYYADGMLESLTNMNSAGSVMDNYTYTYDAARNQLSKTETVSGTAKGTTAFSYDGANRLKSVTEPSGKLTEYSYDKAGNRKTEKVTENGVVAATAYTYNEQERLMTTVQTAENITKTITYQYDNNGNVYSKTQGVTQPDSGELSETAIALLGIDADPELGAIYEYNVFNQLVRTYQGNKTIENVYNAEGLRVSKTVNGETCNYLYEYDKIVLETDGAGNQTARNVYGTSLLSREAGGEKLTYHYNGHGDVTSLTNTSGTVTASYYYDVFGNHLSGRGGGGEQDGAGESLIDNPFRYAGYEFDDETDLYYLKSRFYSAETARFLQEDTYRGDPSDPLSLNLYVYCANAPIRYWDPTGFSYNGTEFNSFEEFYQYTLDNPGEAQMLLYRLNDTNRSAFYAIINDYVAYQGEIKRGNSNVYQIVYGAMPGGSGALNSRDMTWDSSAAITAERNMFDDYEFTLFDALNWMIQSGGSGNFILQTRVTREWGESAGVQREMVGKFMDARNFLRGAGRIDGNTTPQLFIGSTETQGSSAIWIYTDIMGTDWLQNDQDIIGGIYYGHEDASGEAGDIAMSKVSDFMYEQHKKLIWMPYVTDTRSAKELVGYADKTNWYGKPLFDVIIIQPGEYYGGKPEVLQEVFAEVEDYNRNPTSATKIGFEMEFDMGLVTGRWDREEGKRMEPGKKREVFLKYLAKFNELTAKYPNMPVGVYSGGPNEQGYRNIRANTNPHNNGNHIPYGEGIVGEWYAYKVPYSEFPAEYIYEGGNLIYDINEYIYNGGPLKPAVSSFLEKKFK